MERETVKRLGRTVVRSLEDGLVDGGGERVVGRPTLAAGCAAGRAGGNHGRIDVHERLLDGDHLRSDMAPDSGGGGDGGEIPGEQRWRWRKSCL